MRGYGQFCPVAKASEILGERWTTLVVRELLSGAQSFNALRRGLPLVSPTLLSNRLRSLEHRGVIVRQENAGSICYRLTEAGEELRPIITELGFWGQRWARSESSPDDLDPKLLMWDIHRRLDLQRMPHGRHVIHVEFEGCPSATRFWWLITGESDVDVCLKDPGYSVDLYIFCQLDALVRIWMGDAPLHKEMASQRIRLKGDPQLCETFADWFMLNVFAGVERPGKKERVNQ